jgi:capsular exopolysaccharide synthesis family protein
MKNLPPSDFEFDDAPVATGSGLAQEENAMQRNARNYVATLRERIWYILTVFLVVFLAAVVYTLGKTKQYTASATVEVLRREAVVMQVQEVRDSDLRGPEDLNTHVKILESGAIIQRVAARLSPEETKSLLEPYQTGGAGDPIAPGEVLAQNRRVAPMRGTRLIQVVFTHPDPDVAARVANHFVEEFMNYNSRWRVDESLKAVEELKIRADQQSRKVQELGNNLQAYRERYGMVSLDQRKDIVTEKLRAASTLLTQATSRLAEAELRWKQVEEFQKAGRSLSELSFIGSLAQVQTLTQRFAAQKITVAELRQRYLEKYPTMQEALRSMSETESELTRALDSAAETIRNEYDSAKRMVEAARAELKLQEEEDMKLGRHAVDFNTLQNELSVNQELLASIVTRMRETSMNANIESQNARIVDRAFRPIEPSSPNLIMHLAIGAFAGLGLGLGLALTVAFFDDRLKSAYYIETSMGLSLIGMVPAVSGRSKPLERAQIVGADHNPEVVESFRSLHSNLKLKDESGKTKVLLVTSSTPGEGKSFVTSNLGLTFAEHGERTVIVDCDLRRPNVHRSFELKNDKGVVDYCMSGAPLEQIVHTQQPCLDIITAGQTRGRLTPTHVLNSKTFPKLIAELRTRYDRIILDTPPLSPVSDALLMLPHADGSLFTMRFNYVRAGNAKLCIRRLQDGKTPCLGAVFNAVEARIGDYYYAEHYGKAAQNYLLANQNVVRS